MPEYRAYIVGSDGYSVDFEPLVCTDDAEATEKAKRLVDGHDVELWKALVSLWCFSPLRTKSVPLSGR